MSYCKDEGKDRIVFVTKEKVDEWTEERIEVERQIMEEIKNKKESAKEDETQDEEDENSCSMDKPDQTGCPPCITGRFKDGPCHYEFNNICKEDCFFKFIQDKNVDCMPGWQVLHDCIEKNGTEFPRRYTYSESEDETEESEERTDS